MEKNTKIKFLKIEKENLELTNVIVNDLTIKDDNSYVVGDDNKIVHNCLTFPYTGFGSRNCQPMIIEECYQVAKKPIISDGGIREPGDIAKSLVMGATICMIGSMLSGYNDSPGNVITKDGKSYKEFWGSASEFQSGKSSRIEGKKVLIEYKNQSLLNGLDFLTECLQSSISYGGGKDLSCFNKVKYIV